MDTAPKISERVAHLSKSAIHEMTRLSKQVEDVAFLSWAKPTVDTPDGPMRASETSAGKGILRYLAIRDLALDDLERTGGA